MKNKFSISIIIIFILIFNTIVSANTLKNNTEMNINNINFNKEILLGSASIIGNGNSSELIANLENNILIKLDSTSDIVDFYITYDINCNGLTDEGVITLTIFLNDENISFNLVQSPTNKNGSLKVENVSVKRGDALTFRIDVAYVSVIPFYTNSTSATGVGVISKSKYISDQIFIFGSNIDVKNIQLEQDENHIDLEVVDKSLYIFINGLFKKPVNMYSGAFIRLYNAKGIFSNSIPICIGFCSNWGIIG